MANPTLTEEFDANGTNADVLPSLLKSDGYAIEQVVESKHINTIFKELYDAANKNKKDGVWDYDATVEYGIGSIINYLGVTYQSLVIQTGVTPVADGINWDIKVNKKYVDDNLEPTWVANDSRAKTALNASGTAPIYACRAWVNFNGTGTVAIRASGNVSSITDNGTGDYKVNFITAMPDENYSMASTIRHNITSYLKMTTVTISTTSIPTTNNISINTGSGDDNSNNYIYCDCDYVCASIFR